MDSRPLIQIVASPYIENTKVKVLSDLCIGSDEKVIRIRNYEPRDS